MNITIDEVLANLNERIRHQELMIEDAKAIRERLIEKRNTAWQSWVFETKMAIMSRADRKD